MNELPVFKSYDGKEYSGKEIFKLVFSREDGKFLGVEVQANILYCTYDDMKNIEYEYEYEYPFADRKNEKVSFADLLHTAKIESCKFVDIYGHSVCGGSCGGIAFNWCR